MKLIVDLLPLLLWAGLWIAGGCLLAGALFRLRPSETALIGLALGLILQIWLANLLAHVLPIVAASWSAAGLLLAAGLAASIAFHSLGLPGFEWRQWTLFAVLALIFTLIGRGLGIFDDYQNLPTISLMATGDVPPHFALNPSLNFGYHYFLLLFSAQLMRLGNMFPWTALDLARGLILALPLMLAGLWARRIARSSLAAVLTGGMLAFAGGSRWLLLFLPMPWLQHISDSIRLIGSASTSAPSLAQAMLTSWKIDGAGPMPFPFAFYTGINQPYVMAYTGIAGSGILILLAMLLTANRRRVWAADIVTVGLLAALALANEIGLLLLIFGSGLMTAAWIIVNRSWKLSAGLINWLLVLLAAGVIAAIQGGLLTEILRDRFAGVSAQSSYFDTSLSFVWPPAVVSAHLGSLSIASLPQLVAALAEIGPVVLVTPLAVAWAIRSYRLGKWFEAALIASSAGAVIALFIAFKGPLFTATPRLMGGWFFVCILYAVPLLWVWARRRSGTQQAAIAVLTLTSCLGGLVLFGTQLLAIQKPVLATFISPLDARMAQDYWDRLKPRALIFDTVVYRAPTVFGRFTRSSPSWYATDPQWELLRAAADPVAIRAAGFEYMYFDKDFWDSLSSSQQTALEASCVRQIAEVDGIHSEKDYSKDFRRLLDILDCK